MDIQTLKIIAYVIIGGALFLILVKHLSKPKKCSTCSTLTKGVYRNEQGDSVILCNNHIAETWSKDMLHSTSHMIVTEPDFENFPYGYMYADTHTLRQWSYPQIAIDNVSVILKSIVGIHCKDCGADASVAYYPKSEFEVGLFENMKPCNHFLCKKCAVKHIAPLLQKSTNEFMEGVYAPTNEAGIFHVQEF